MADVGARRCKRNRAWHRAQWREHVGNQARSGLSAAAYCRAHGLTRSSFYRWGRIFRTEDAAAGGASGLDEERAQTPVPPVFAELRVTPTPASAAAETSGVEVVLPGQRRLRVVPGFDEDTLRRAVRVLESLSC
jgi:transposase